MCSKGVYPSLSVERLGVDINEDPLPLITHLLFQCWSDFSQVYGASNVKGLEQLNHIYEKLTDRLNVLVILSSKVYLRLRYAAHLRQSLLLAVYRVLSLALWSRQRALRCASLRCLRYHLRSSSDVDLFLTNRLDVFLTRCLDLSYEEELLTPSSTTIRDQNALQEKDRIQRMLQPAGAFRRRVDGCQPVGGNGVLQRPIRKISPRNAITSSGERMSVLQVAFQLLRLSPQSFSPDLVYGLAASLTSTSHRSAVTRGRGSDRERDDDFFPLSPSIQTNTTRERDVCQRGYLLLLTEYVVRNFEMQPPQSPQSLSRMSLSHPLEVAIKCLVSSLPCCGEVGEVYKHPSQLLEMLLLVLVRVSAESRLGRRLVGSWVFQKCVSPFMAGYPLVTIPRSPYDSNPSFLAATRDSLVFILRSWPGLFYFLSEGRNCLISLVSSLAVGSSKLRILVLSLLYNLFPGIPAPLPNVAGENTIDKVLAGLSSALLTGLAYPLEHFQSKRQPSANECFPPFPYLDGDFVVEEGMRVFPVVQAAGTDILEAHSSLLLCSLVESGLFEALVAAVNDESPYTSAAAGQLLGILAFRINSQLPLGSPCVARLQSVRLLGTNSQAVDYLDRIHRLLLDLHHSSRNSRILAPLHSPFLECLADQRLGLRRSSPRTPLARTSPVKNEGTNVATVLRKTAASSRSTVLPQPLDEFVENIVVQSRVLSLATTPLLTINSATTTATSLLLNSIKHTANGSITSPVCKSSLPSNTGVPTNNYGSVASGVSPVTPYSSPYEWNWELLATWGRRLARIDTGSVFSWREHNRQLFLTRLMDFLTPNLDVLAMPLDVAYPAGVSTTYSLFEGGRGEGGEGIFPLSPAYVRLLDRRNINGTSSTAAAATTTTVTPSLAWTSRHWPQAWAAATLIASLLPHLCLYAPDSLPGVLLRRFLSSIHTCLIASATPSQSPMTTCIHLLFQTNHMRDHCSSLLLFAIGRLAAFEDGAALLQSLGFPESLLTLTIGNEKNRSEYRPVNVKETINNQRFLCSKILLASMDYSGPGIGRSLLVSICSWGHNALRLFATKFIRLLLRLKIPGTQSWCVPLLVTLSFDPDPKVVYEAVSVLEEACLDPVSVQILLDHLHPDKKSTGTAFQAANRCCAAFPSPVLHLLSIAGFSSQRIVACLLASSPWMFKLFSTPKSSTVRTLGAYYRSNIVGTPLEYMLQAWLEVYNEEYSRSIESLLQNNFRLHQSPVGVPTTHIGLPSLKLCPACNQSIRSATATLRAPGDQDDDEHFLNRQSNRFFTPFSADSEEGRDVVVELSPVAKQFFFETSHTFVPIHLFSCLASHEAGFRVLLEHGHLQDLADRISLHHHQLPATEGAKPSMTNASPVEVKAAIWALSHVLVTRNGACWARAPGIVDDLFRLTTHAESLSVRGNAWLGLCFIASSSCGADLLSSRGGGAGGPWLITRTDRLAHLWPLRQRRRLCLSPPRQHSDSAEGVDQARPQFHLPPPQTPLPTTATEGAQVMTASSSTEQRIHPTGHDFSESHVALDVEALQLSAISLGSSEAAASAAVSDLVTVKTAANTSSLYSPSTHALNSSLEHLPRPVRWLVSSKGRMTTVALRALNALRKQRNNGADSWKRALSVSSSMNNGSDGAITQSISSPDWFQHHPLDSVIKSKTRSTSPSHCSSASATQRSLSDTFVFRGLILPVDVSTLGRNCFCDSPQRQETPTVEPQLNVVSGQRQNPDIGGSSRAESHTNTADYLSADITRRLCISETCRNSDRPCPQPEVDTEAGSWHCDVLEAIENLMNCVLIGRVDSSLVELYTKAVMRRSEGSPSHIGACLHSEVAQLLSNYSYSRLARTIAQSFLSEFPPFVELLADAKTALDDWNKLVTLDDSVKPAPTTQ